MNTFFLEVGEHEIVVEADCWINPAEQETRDYPGCPASVELGEVRVISFNDVSRREDWFPILDKIAEQTLLEDWEEHEKAILQEADDRHQAALDDYWEAKIQEQRERA